MLEEKTFKWENEFTVSDADLLDTIAWYCLDDDDNTTEEDFANAIGDYIDLLYEQYGDSYPSEIEDYIEQRIKELAHQV